MANCVTLEEHREFLHKLLGVQLYFTALWAASHPEEELHHIIEARTQIYKYTYKHMVKKPGDPEPTREYFETPAWQHLMAAANEAYRKFSKDPNGFEQALAGVFGEAVDLWSELDYTEMMMPPEGYQCGCFRHDTALWRDTGWLCFHIGNPVRPHSIFEREDYIKRCLLLVADHAEMIYNAKYVATNTWLNSNPKFVRLFPEEWKTNMRPASGDVAGHLGCWGQFINGKGLFNERIGAQFRATGKLPFAQRESFCTIESLRKHLETL